MSVQAEIKRRVSLKTTNGGASPGWRQVDWEDDTEDTVHVSEVAARIISVAVDEDDIECAEQDAIRDVSADYAHHIVCMRSPTKKTPPHSDPIAAIKDAIRRGRFRVDQEAQYTLNGVDITGLV